MHIPTYFKNENITEIREFLKQNSFGILISMVNNRPWGTHIPLELALDESGEEVLYGHISKANPQWKAFNIVENKEILAIFNGAHAYVSSSWYDHENVPTWNYIAVHVYGELVLIEEAELLYSLKKLVDKYEVNNENPIKVENLSAKTMKQLKGVVGFKIKIKEIQAAYKLSQNRNTTDYQNIINELDKTENPAAVETAKIMKGRNLMTDKL